MLLRYYRFWHLRFSVKKLFSTSAVLVRTGHRLCDISATIACMLYHAVVMIYCKYQPLFLLVVLLAFCSWNNSWNSNLGFGNISSAALCESFIYFSLALKKWLWFIKTLISWLLALVWNYFLAVFNEKLMSHRLNKKSDLANLMVGLWLALEQCPNYLHE